jgi:hypothetical protein
MACERSIVDNGSHDADALRVQGAAYVGLRDSGLAIVDESKAIDLESIHSRKSAFAYLVRGQTYRRAINPSLADRQSSLLFDRGYSSLVAERGAFTSPRRRPAEGPQGKEGPEGNRKRQNRAPGATHAYLSSNAPDLPPRKPPPSSKGYEVNQHSDSTESHTTSQAASAKGGSSTPKGDKQLRHRLPSIWSNVVLESEKKY